MSDIARPSPPPRRIGFPVLMFGAAAAPIFWLGQLCLSYGLTAFGCYGGDHPQILLPPAMLTTCLIGFDVVAILAAVAGGATAFRCLNRLHRQNDNGLPQALQIGEGRARFLALWGIFSSLCFLCAILFNTIATFTVPPCVQ